MNCSSLTGVELWGALPTPFLPSGAVDEAGLRLNVRRCIDAGLDGVYCNGLMGEGWALGHDERKHIVQTIIDEAAHRLLVTPVTSAATLEETIELAAHARDVGAAYAVLDVPASGGSERDVLDHFDAIFAAVDMPFVIFNAGKPGTRESTLSLEAFSALCNRPNVKILKTTAHREFNIQLRSVAKGADVRVSDPLEEHFFENLLEHGQTLLYCDPEGYLYQSAHRRPIQEYIRLCREGRVREAKDVFDSLAAIRRVYRKWIIGPLENGEMPNAALKKWCELIGMAGGAVRRPLEELTADESQELTQDVMRALEQLDETAPHVLAPTI